MDRRHVKVLSKLIFFITYSAPGKINKLFSSNKHSRNGYVIQFCAFFWVKKGKF